MSEYNEIFHMALDQTSNTEESENNIVSGIVDDYSGAPVTPRGPSGELEGDRQDKIDAMPLPQEQMFVVMSLKAPGPKEVVLRPIPGSTWTIFHTRLDAKLVAESQCRANPDFAFGLYGPYETNDEIVKEPWHHPRSTPCDTYEMVEVIVRREYYPRTHERAGKLRQVVRELVCNHVDFGFVAPSKNVMEDPSAVVISGSMLTSYLTPAGDLISPNVSLMAKPPTKEHMKEADYGKMYQQVINNQKDVVDVHIDDEFRKALPTLHALNVNKDVIIPFQIWHTHKKNCYRDEDGNLTDILHCTKQPLLFEGEQAVRAKKLPLSFAQILRTALTSWYGKVTFIQLYIDGQRHCFFMSEED